MSALIFPEPDNVGDEPLIAAVEPIVNREDVTIGGDVESQTKELLGHVFGGEPSVREGRESVTYVTLDELIDDINTSKDGYCFLRVLNRSDRASFLSVLCESYYTDIYKTKAIRLGLWLNILGSVHLTENYVIYRRTYWGENRGRREIVEQLTNYVTPLWHFNRYKERTNNSFVDELSTMFQSLFTGRFQSESVTRILLLPRDNHMETFIFRPDGYTLASWQNRFYDVPNERYGACLMRRTTTVRLHAP